MSPSRAVAGLVFAAGLVVGTLNDVAPVRVPPAVAGHWILAADFHVHAFPGDGALAPGALQREAARRGLDVITITNHNQTISARIGSWLPRRVGVPLVLVGQEVTARDFHLIAVGIRDEVDWRGPVSTVIDAIHVQGGAAIAAHPLRPFWQGFDDAAMTRLDGAEIAHPAGTDPGRRADMSAFYERARERNPRLAPIGSSDYHFSWPVGLCRTYVFAREVSERGVIEAVREGRTVAYDAAGRAYGDPARVAIVEKLRREAGASLPESSTWRHVSLALTLIGLSLLTCGTRLQPREG
ncbi:MAG: CehA/McbA family metallohydrolase [Vicinamibacterales bacterium]